MSLIVELKRRNVIKVAVAYIVAAWMLLQVTDILLPILDLPDWAAKLVFLILLVGFVPALIFAWAFEMTPEGIKKEKDVDRSQSITPVTGRKLNNTIVVLLTLAVAYLLFDKFSAPAQPESDPVSQQTGEQTANAEEKRALTPVETTIPRQSIAVLPFDNRSDQQSDEYFVEGIHDDLLTTIAKIGSMKVISRTSVMEYRDTTKNIREIAKELGVANILEGGIQRSGSQVRINVQLIDAETDEHLWAEIYDRNLTAENLFAIQSEISKEIATALQATLSPEEEQSINTMPTNNLQAYETYMRGRQLMATRDSAKLTQAMEEFNQAVELDPNFALAWVGVADSTYLLSLYGTFSTKEALQIRETAINRALEINDQLGEAYASLGSVLRDKLEFEQAETAFKQAIQLSPNYATAYHWYSNLSTFFPLRLDESMDLIRKAVELDPRSSIIGSTLAFSYRQRGMYSMAERQYLKVIELDPGFTQAIRAFGEFYAETGQYERALFYLRKAHDLSPENLFPLNAMLYVYLDLDNLEAAENIRERISDLDPRHPFVGIADVEISLRRNNAAGTRESINWVLPKITERPWTRQYMGLVELMLGDKSRALEIILAAVPGWMDSGQWLELTNLYQANACIVSWILINTGDEALGRQLLQQSSVYFDDILPAAMEHADSFNPELCYLTAGDIEKALQSIETQLTHNHLEYWNQLHRLPMYDLIRHEPRYQAAMQERARRIEVQREAIKAGGKL